ncbi:L-type lectin-domain containing protein (plasmid) [Bacillus thuringiensis]|uniref:L-type lectin-domain containing protein n=1 Tax=Bacillus thuringiensis TaxID=1428 RepID=UPI003977A775
MNLYFKKVIALLIMSIWIINTNVSTVLAVTNSTNVQSSVSNSENKSDVEKSPLIEKTTIDEKGNIEIDDQEFKTNKTIENEFKKEVSFQEKNEGFLTIDENFDIPSKSNSVSEGDTVHVTKNQPEQLGAIWSKKQLDMTQNWKTEMRLQFNSLDINNVADGMAFVLHNDPRGTTATGDKGQSIGVWNTSPFESGQNYIAQGWAIEFDFYHNGDGLDASLSPTDKYMHIANSMTNAKLDWKGMVHNNLQQVEKTTMSGEHIFEVQWNAALKNLTYRFNVSGDTFWQQDVHLDPISVFGSDNVYWGFTGATGKKEIHQTIKFKSIPQTIQAKPKRKTYVLGDKIEITNNNIDEFITIESGDDVRLKDSSYSFFANIVGENQSIHITLIDKYANEKEYVIPVKVIWGNSILLRGYNDYSIGAYTLEHDGKTNYITATEGITRGDEDGKVHFYFANNQYYWIGRKIPNQSIQNLSDIKTDIITKALGNDIAKEKINSFGNGTQRIDVNSGDIIEVWHAESGKRNVLIVNEEETEQHAGLKSVYYEISKSTFIPLHINQLTPKTINIKNGTSNQELMKKLEECMDLKGYENIQVERFKDKLPDTMKDGEQLIDVVVSETLKSGKKVEYIYTVTFIVNPVVTENIYSSDGTLLDTIQTELKYGVESFSPSPKNRIEFDGIYYKYIGWVAGNQKPGEDIPQTGEPNTVKETTTFNYIYLDLKKLINVTIPIEMIFSSSDKETGNIQSDIYHIENHSDEAILNIKFASMETKEHGGIRLLTPMDSNPGLGIEESMRLNLVVDDIAKINSLNEASEATEIGTLNPKEKLMMKFTGTYFGKITKNKKRTHHNLVFKFSTDE